MHILACFTLVSIKAIHGSPYVPGEPGAAWTMEELLIVKAKLYAVFNHWGVLPPKFLRLGFHDCLKLVVYTYSLLILIWGYALPICTSYFSYARYTDGTGGCDGCLNWEGVGFRFTEGSKFKYENVHRSNNNGLGLTVERLEGIYTDLEFPRFWAPRLTESLQQTGKL